ncbi:MAG: TetR/AcrR family transcriptional regulator [Gammaproteobacteria bacterium]|nr:TetR/AcrR family transcriptional regulator [Gammaproteobacteria bacterium]
MSYVAERRLEEKERRRLEILDAAEAVAAVVGIEAMTMDQVARKARLSRALVYVYFHDKSDLLIAISVRALEQLAERFSAVIAEPISGRAQAEACGRAYVTFAKEFPVRFDVLAHFEAHSPSGELDPANEQFLSTGERSQSMLTAAIITGMRDGSIRKEIGDPVLLGFTLWGLMHGVIQLTVRKIGGLQRAGISAEQLIEQAFRFAIDAMSPDSRSAGQPSADLRSGP